MCEEESLGIAKYALDLFQNTSLNYICFFWWLHVWNWWKWEE